MFARLRSAIAGLPPVSPLLLRLGVAIPTLLSASAILVMARSVGIERLDQFLVSSGAAPPLGYLGWAVLSSALALALIAGIGTRFVAGFLALALLVGRIDMSRVAEAQAAGLLHNVGDFLSLVFVPLSLTGASALLAYVALVLVGGGAWSLDARLAAASRERSAQAQSVHQAAQALLRGEGVVRPGR